MEGTKLDISEETVSRPKSLTKLKTSGETDGADEKMLPAEDKTIPLDEKQNGDANLEIGDLKTVFGGMDKEELMKYANDPFWVRLRWFLFISFWLLWAAMLVGAILIIYAAPKCDPPPPKTWWEEGPLTEINSDLELKEIKSLEKNVKGFIVSWTEDAYNIDESHDLIKAVKQASGEGSKIIIDLDPATSSVWFENSEANNSTWSDYYIWKSGKPSANGPDTPEPPNNWLNEDNKSSWKYSETRKQFYYSPLEKPHLNFRNENVTKEFSKVIKQLLDLGASGIRVRNVPLLLVDPKFESEKGIANAAGFDHSQYRFYTHSKTENLPDLAVLLNEWRKVVKNKTEEGPFIASEELSNIESYKINNSLVVDLPLQAHIFSKSNILVNELVNSINHTFNIDNITWPLWKVNTSALPMDVLDIVTFLLPGTPLVNSDVHLDAQLLKIRESPSIMRGICNINGINNNTVFAYIRVTPGNPGILVALNTLNERVVVNFQKEISALSELSEVSIQLYSSNFNETGFMDINAKKDARAIPISPKSVIVLSYVPKKKD